ncbi:hypothetical protein KXV52_002936, partial [Aspergillus fumigatus]
SVTDTVSYPPGPVPRRAIIAQPMTLSAEQTTRSPSVTATLRTKAQQGDAKHVCHMPHAQTRSRLRQKGKRRLHLRLGQVLGACRT